MNKISPHIIGWNNDVLDFIRLAKPTFAKVMVPQGHDTMKLARAKELSPHTKWICRLYVDEQPLDRPRSNALDFIEGLAPYLPSYDIFEGYNEPPPYGPDDWKRLNEFEHQLAREVQLHGKQYCAFNWSNGQPPYEAWFHLLDAIREADYIGIHSYGWPTLRDCEGLALRHRTLPRTGKPIILTEFGFTELVANPQGEDVGWRKWDIHPWGARQYRCIEELAWMADRLAEDSYVLGACYFVTGRLRGDQWLTHDLTPAIYRKIAGYVAQPNSNDEEDLMDVPDWLVDLRETLKTHPDKKYARRGLGEIDTIVIHHTATSHATPEQIANYHVGTLKWPGAGYHLYIRKSGAAYLMNDLEAMSYQCYKHNQHTLGLGFEGDFTKESHTEDQIRVGRLAVDWLCGLLGADLPARAHGKMPDQSTACPGKFPVGELTGEEQEDETEQLLAKIAAHEAAMVAARNILNARIDA